MKKYSIVETLYRNKYDAYFRIAYNLCRDRWVAEDLLSDSFLKLMSWGGALESSEHCGILLTKIIRQQWSNMCAKKVRAEKHEDSIHTFMEILEYTFTPPPIDFYPLGHRKLQELRKLTPTEKLVVECGVLNDMKQNEIQDRFGICGNSVGTIKNNAFKKLKRADPAESRRGKNPISYRNLKYFHERKN